jgi:hypothetical protein
MTARVFIVLPTAAGTRIVAVYPAARPTVAGRRASLLSRRCHIPGITVVIMVARYARRRGRRARAGVIRLITGEGVAVSGAFDSDTATGMMPVAHRVAGVLAFRRS